MSGTVITISHDPEDSGDRCTNWLIDNGYRVESICPAVGQPIPELNDGVDVLIVFGGRYDVKMQHEFTFLKDELRLIDGALRRGIPFLGICLGGQLLAHALGEDIDLHPGGFAEYGYYDLIPTPEGREFAGSGLKVLQSHWHGWYETPKGAVRLAHTENFPQQAFRYGAAAYGMQFHPEATRAMLERWIGRRPPERYRLAGTHPPDRQITDHQAHDAALGAWFHDFLGRWIGPRHAMLEAAE